MKMNVLSLAQQLIAMDTSSGGESFAIDCVARILEFEGFALTVVPWEPGRPNLIARWRGGGPLTLAAHLDTVPFDASTWTVDPLLGDISDGRLYGRGSSDMKSGAAAMVCAAVEAARANCRPFTAVFTSAEETGCRGARAVAASGLLHSAPILIVGEATENVVRFGHKGATWLELVVRGRAAHGSRPELGESAVNFMAEAIVALRDRPVPAPHAALGSVTTNVGTIVGGQQTNLVPDYASMTIDVRTVPGQGVDDVIALVEKTSGGQAREILNVPSVWTDPMSDLSRWVGRTVTAITGVLPAENGASYFTDGAVLTDLASPAVYIIGPGGLDQPHTSDESCAVDRIEQAVEIYRSLIIG